MWQSLAENFSAYRQCLPYMVLKITGCQIVSITSDGVATNRNVWSILEVSLREIRQLIQFFENPFNTITKKYVFSDFPHLMKTIQNRLFKNKELRPGVDPVKFAVQVFNKSMAIGIELYRNKNYDCFKGQGSEETVAFTKTINDMLGALNRRYTY
ncbi:Uncharacterized protein FWK35_00006300 [Aphis craccivora]|uniref:Transposable element P transposase n=1 Tax=Aphis craccivora TaxID=307492 RepID=A0A6G0ZR67_APHCR|nr:Uncharacterized protein FWK35_00006300 [Aphis craccivora]